MDVERSEPRRSQLDKLLVSHLAVVLQEVGLLPAALLRSDA